MREYAESVLSLTTHPTRYGSEESTRSTSSSYSAPSTPVGPRRALDNRWVDSRLATWRENLQESKDVNHPKCGLTKYNLYFILTHYSYRRSPSVASEISTLLEPIPEESDYSFPLTSGGDGSQAYERRIETLRKAKDAARQEFFKDLMPKKDQGCVLQCKKMKSIYLVI